MVTAFPVFELLRESQWGGRKITTTKIRLVNLKIQNQKGCKRNSSLLAKIILSEAAIRMCS